MEIKDNRCFKKFEDLEIGDIFCVTFDDVYMKISEISLKACYNLPNAVSLQTGTLYAISDNEDVQILKASLIIE